MYVEATEDRKHIDEGPEKQQKTDSVEMDVTEKESGSTEDISEENKEDEMNKADGQFRRRQVKYCIRKKAILDKILREMYTLY